MEKQLELRYLAAYLPYGLNYQDTCFKTRKYSLTGIQNENVWISVNSHTQVNDISDLRFKPILRPLSDLKNVPDIYLILSFESIEEFEEKETLTFDKLFYWEVENLCKNHFDIFDLINAGLAIDINTLNTTENGS